MKILFTSPFYFPDVSGVPNVVKYLAEGLVSLGHQVSVVTTLPEGEKRQASLNGVEIHRFCLNFKKLKGYVGETEEYKKFVADFDCDVIINECTQCPTTDLILDILKEKKCKKLLHVHGFSGLKFKLFDLSNGLKYFLGSMYNFFRFRRYYFNFQKYSHSWDKVIHLSEISNSLSYFNKCSFDKNEILYNASDLIFDPERDYPHDSLAPKGKYLITTAYFQRIKNQKLSIQEFYKLPEELGLSLLLVGTEESPYLSELKALKSKLDKKIGKRNVHFIVGVERERIPNLISNAFLYLSTSVQEEFSISLIESMTLGVPFVSTDVGNAKLLPGGIVEKGQCFSEQIEKLLFDNELYNSLSEEGKKFSKDYCSQNAALFKLSRMINDLDK